MLSLEVGVEKKIHIYNEEGVFEVNRNHRLGGLTINIRDRSNPPALGHAQGCETLPFSEPFSRKVRVLISKFALK